MVQVMMSSIKKRLIILVALVIFLVLNCFNSYSLSATDAVINAYKLVDVEQKELLHKSLKQIIENEWNLCIKRSFEKEKRIDILMNSKYENGKLVSKNYNYHISKVSTPSTLAAFIYCLDRECNTNGYEYDELNEDGINEFLQNGTLTLIAKIISKDENVERLVKSFVNYTDVVKKNIGKTIVGNDIYMSIEFGTDEDKKIPGMSVLHRGDLNYYIYNQYSRSDIIEYISNEGILK